MFKLNSLIVFSENPARLVEFYGKVFGTEPSWKGEEGQFVGWNVGGGYFAVGPHDKVHGENANPERIMFGLESENVEEDYKRLVEMGAREVHAPYHPGESPDMWLATLADPDNNYFQLTSPMTM